MPTSQEAHGPGASLDDASLESHREADDAPNERSSLSVLARLFLKLGVVAFGGPAAHIAMLEDEVVTRRKWLDRQHFLDLVGATNLIPGPNSTEMTMHVGYERAGWKGLLTAGACFIGPAVLVTGGLGWLYVTYGEVPAVAPLLYGIKPAVLAVILAAVWKLGREAVKDWRMALTGTAVGALVLGGTGEIVALLVGGAVGGLWRHYTAPSNEDGPSTAARLLPILFLQKTSPQVTTPDSSRVPEGPVFRALPDSGKAAAAGTAAAGGVSLWKLGFFFLKIGSILYGSGYVLVAFLQGDLVEGYGWLTQQQLLDAIAIGQFTPGPVLSTSTFIGYVIAGVAGAGVATLGIFLPSFVFVSILNPLVPRLRNSARLSAILDAVNVSAVALMGAVTIQLGAGVLTAWPAWVIAGLAALGALIFRLNAAWLVLGGAALGWGIRILGWGL